jgi:hypothetical protein
MRHDGSQLIVLPCDLLATMFLLLHILGFSLEYIDVTVVFQSQESPLKVSLGLPGTGTTLTLSAKVYIFLMTSSLVHSLLVFLVSLAK